MRERSVEVHGKGSVDSMSRVARTMEAIAGALGRLPGVSAQVAAQMVCDGCGRVSPPLPSDRAAAEVALTGLGWGLAPDLCPDCAAKEGR